MAVVVRGSVAVLLMLATMANVLVAPGPNADLAPVLITSTVEHERATEITGTVGGGNWTAVIDKATQAGRLQKLTVTITDPRGGSQRVVAEYQQGRANILTEWGGRAVKVVRTYLKQKMGAK